MTNTKTVRRAQRDEGAIAYDETGDPSGPVVLCLPSLGDTRAEYRALVPGLVESGARVLTADMRGHGESDTSFTRYDLRDHAEDIIAVLDDAGAESAVVVGCSLSAGSAILAAADHPDRIRGLVLVGPAARPAPMAKWIVPLMAWLLTFSIGKRLWVAYYASLFKKSPPADLEAHLEALRQVYAQPARRRALAEVLRGIPRIVDAEAFWARCVAPAAIVMGSADPDQSDPTAEAHALGAGLGGHADVTVLDGVGHYPHLEDPAAVLAAYRALTARLDVAAPAALREAV